MKIRQLHLSPGTHRSRLRNLKHLDFFPIVHNHDGHQFFPKTVDVCCDWWDKYMRFVYQKLRDLAESKWKCPQFTYALHLIYGENQAIKVWEGCHQEVHVAIQDLSLLSFSRISCLGGRVQSKAALASPSTQALKIPRIPRIYPCLFGNCNS